MFSSLIGFCIGALASAAWTYRAQISAVFQKLKALI